MLSLLNHFLLRVSLRAVVPPEPFTKTVKVGDPGAGSIVKQCWNPAQKMVSPVRQFDIVTDRERVLDIVRSLVSELGRQSSLPSVSPGAHLERELGLGSLERVELLVRLEKTFGTRLDEHVLTEADTVEDLICAL